MTTETQNHPAPSNEVQVLAQKLDHLIAALLAPKVPVHKELWNSAQTAAYLKVTKEKFLRNIACKKTFPKARNVDPDTSNATNHRWNAGEVMAWAEAQKVH